MYVDILILAFLAERPHHGYEIKKNVERVLGGEVTLNNGVLYPALRRFEEMGAVEREVERQAGKPDRHIYRLTDLGREILHDLLCEFPADQARNDTEFIVRVAFFDLIEPGERRYVLEARAAALRKALVHHDQILAWVDAEGAALSPYARATMNFRRDTTRHELDWLAELMRLAADEHERGHAPEREG
jgi:DNA-binding PadR family transcriptional regulator